ncbi:inversin-like [Limulus polyphemus]|uniref:Inversin-like n=1 Tax=Limulus polyphemus TaxID=6850 RepID=A0ABM1BUE2_LIMPO|nr:inversin-like [Limulus polyphemus]
MNFLSNEISPLHETALSANKTSMKKFLETAPAVALEHKDDFGRTPLIYSILQNNLSCASLLLKEGARVDNSDNVGQTPLHWACHEGLPRFVRVLLDSGARWDQKDVDGVTPLHLAAAHPLPQCLALILQKLQTVQVDMQDGQKGANVLLPDIDGKTPLHLAASQKNHSAVECVKMLLEESPGVIDWQDYEGRSALHLAVAKSTTEVVDILTSRDRCHINQLDNMFRTPLHWAAVLGLADKAALLLDRGADHTSTDGKGATPLHYSAQGNHAETVAVFLARKYCCMPDKPDSIGLSALIWGAAKGADSVIQTMHDFRFDVSVPDKNGNTALHAAASQGHSTTIALLLQLGSPLEAVNREKKTPLLWACEMGRTKAVLLLLDSGASLAVSDVQGRTPLHWSALGGHSYLCQLLVQHGCDPDAEDYYGRCALHYASYKGYLNCLSVLLEIQADPNHIDNEGKTPLHWACTKGNLEMVELLCNHGANVNFMSRLEDRCTPLDCASNNGHIDLVQYLRERNGASAAEVLEVAAVRIQAAYRGHRTRTFLHLFHIKAGQNIKTSRSHILSAKSYFMKATEDEQYQRTEPHSEVSCSQDTVKNCKTVRRPASFDCSWHRISFLESQQNSSNFNSIFSSALKQDKKSTNSSSQVINEYKNAFVSKIPVAKWRIHSNYEQSTAQGYGLPFILNTDFLSLFKSHLGNVEQEISATCSVPSCVFEQIVTELKLLKDSL